MNKDAKKTERYGKSRGEKLFDWLTYGGIAGAAVFIGTMPLTFWTKYGAGSKFHAWLTGSLTKQGMSEHAAEMIFNSTVLGALGHAAIVPVKFLEDRKPECVEKLNRLLGEKDDIETVKEEPKQSWGSLVKSRVLAVAAAWVGFQGASTLFGKEKFKHFEDKFAEHVVCKPFGKATHIAGQETRWFRYGKVAAIDVFATTAAATILYVGSRIFAKKKEEKSELPKHAGENAAPIVAEETAAPKYADKVKSCKTCPITEKTQYHSLGEKLLAGRETPRDSQIATG